MRSFKPTRDRKHKHRRGVDDKSAATDSNAPQILTASKAEQAETRRKLKEELRKNFTKISGKKQKRLDKYIDNKLRKDENRELLDKLAQEHAKLNGPLNLQSSRNLGKRTHSQYARDLVSVDDTAASGEDTGTETNSDDSEILITAQKRAAASQESYKALVLSIYISERLESTNFWASQYAGKRG